MSTVVTAGQVIARTDKLTLERDGTNGGWRISWVASPGNTTIAFTGLTTGGATVPFVSFLANPGAPGSIVVFTDVMDLVSFRGSFGDSNTPGHQTEVSASRYVGDAKWSGTLNSTFNQ